MNESSFQHLMVNGGASVGGGGVIQAKLSVPIQRRRKRRRQQHQLNRRSEFLLDSGLMSSTGHNLMLQVANQFSGISPTLSSSSSSSASTSSLASSIESVSPSALVQAATDFANYRPTTQTTVTVGATANNPQQPHNFHPQQWHPGCCLSGPNINNNYLIPTPVYDNPNEVIDGAALQQEATAASTALEEEETQEVMFYEGNNNPLSTWREFLLTANKNGPGESAFNGGPIKTIPISPVHFFTFSCFSSLLLQIPRWIF